MNRSEIPCYEEKNSLNTTDAKEKGQAHFLHRVRLPLFFWGRARRIKSFFLAAVPVILLFVSACGPAPTPAPAPAETATATLTVAATFTPSPTATIPPTVTPTPEPAWYQLLDPALGVLKYQYAVVNTTNARVYRTLEDMLARNGNFGFLPRYPAYVAYTATETRDGHTYYLANYGWMDGDDLSPLTPSPFTGVLLTRQVSFRFGWMTADVQSVNGADAPVRPYARYQIVHEVPAAGQKSGFIAVGADEWLPEDSVALVSATLPADSEQGACRFMYVNLAEQTLSVYENCQLVFATLVSSGKNSQWTVPDRYTILYKASYSTITPPDGSTSEYYIEGVPYFMTYSGDFGFHGAYWHDSFGAPASHGCINLAPADARWLFDWAREGDIVIISAGK
jgi:lipoprotein-anchoring transpeptidase ErfK/SrfK